MPLLDALFARADAALGLNWLAVLSFIDGHLAFGRLCALPTIPACCMVSVLIVLAATWQLARLADYPTLFTATGI